MIKILTPMQVLINAYQQLKEQAEEHLKGESKKVYIEALDDMFNALKEYF